MPRRALLFGGDVAAGAAEMRGGAAFALKVMPALGGTGSPHERAHGEGAGRHRGALMGARGERVHAAGAWVRKGRGKQGVGVRARVQKAHTH